MEQPSEMKPTIRRPHRRRALAILTLAAVIGVGLLLQQNGKLNAVVASLLNRQPATQPPPPDFVIRVFDERGQPVPAFEIELLCSGIGVTTWETGSAGQCTFSGFQSVHYRDRQAIDAVVRADGYASTLAHFAGNDRETLLGGNATITLSRGEEVELHTLAPDGLRLPDNFMPEVYFGDVRTGVRIMWNPENQPAYKGHMPDFNYLNVKRSQGGRLVCQIAKEPAPFYVAANHPGFLRFFESGPLTAANLKGGVLDIALPKPAALDVRFDPGQLAIGETAQNDVFVEVAFKDMLTYTYLTVLRHAGRAARQKVQAADLAPGTYKASVMASAKHAPQRPPESSGHPPLFRDSADLVLAAGASRQVDFRYTSFDENGFRGDSTALVRIVNSDGSPAGGCKVKVQYHDSHYGDFDVLAGKTSAQGELTVAGITGRLPDSAVSAPFQVFVDDQMLGSFAFNQDHSRETFEFRRRPEKGDAVPNIELVHVKTGVRSKLHDLRGKVVCLELWAMWCGPC
jgi:hypothetical protein